MIWEKATAWKLWGTTVTIIHSSPLSHCQFLWQFCQCPTTFTFPFWVRHNTCTHTHTFSLLIHSLLESLSLSHTHTHTHTLSLMHTHTHSLTHTHSFSYTHTLSLSVSLSHTLFLSVTHFLKQRHTLSLALTHTSMHTRTQTTHLTHMYTQVTCIGGGTRKAENPDRQAESERRKERKEKPTNDPLTCWPAVILHCWDDVAGNFTRLWSSKEMFTSAEKAAHSQYR